MVNALKQKRNYDTLIRLIDKNGWHAIKDKKFHQVEMGFRVECNHFDHIRLFLSVRADGIKTLAIFPFSVADGNEERVLRYVTEINGNLVDGCFEYDCKKSLRYKSWLPAYAPLTNDGIMNSLAVVNMEAEHFGDNLYELSQFRNLCDNLAEVDEADMEYLADIDEIIAELTKCEGTESQSE